MSEIQSILENLTYIASQKRTVILITNFRGVPIQLAASVVRSSPNGGSVRLCVNQRQIVALKVTDQVLMQSDLFSSTVIAEIAQVALRSQIITLSGLHYVTGSMGNRKNVRVQPENPIHAEIISKHGFSLLGEVVDISLDGLSVRLPKNSLQTDEMLVPQTFVEIRLGLPEVGKEKIHDLFVQAQIAYVKSDPLTYRVGLLTFLEEADIQTARRYIFDRQTEILGEIQKMNCALLKTT